MAKKTKKKTNGLNGAAGLNGSVLDAIAALDDSDETLAELNEALATADEQDDAATASTERPEQATAAAAQERPKTRNLPCRLTKREKRLRGEAIAKNFETAEQLEGEIERLSDDLKALKGKLQGLGLDNRRLMRAIREGREWRDVECVERRNDELNVMESVRLDTGEVLETRPFSATERQGELFGTATAGGPL
jgi:chromosome segregation ATPase